jgi:hypothetical protein
MQARDYKKATIQERKNAKAVQYAVDQLTTDIPDAKVTEAKLYSRTAPLPNENLRIKGPRWYVTANIHNPKNDSKAQALYRVWHSQEEWKAAQVRIL